MSLLPRRQVRTTSVQESITKQIGEGTPAAIIVLTVGAVVIGATQAGSLGALTGLVSALTIGGGLLNALGYSRDSVGTSQDARGRAERLSALCSGSVSLAAVIYGGWRFGWAWGIAGYVLGMTLGMVLTARWHRWGSAGTNTASSSDAVERTALEMNKRVSIHDAYCDFLADNPPSLFPASALPGSVDEIKSALLFVALKRQADGTLTPEMLRHTKQSFCALARCVQPERARAATTLDKSVDAYNASPKGDEDLMAAAQALRAAMTSDASEPRDDEVAALWSEFDERWGRAQKELQA